MGTTIGDYIGTTIGIHSPIPYYAPDSISGATSRHEPLRLMDKILHDPKDPKLWELWYIPYYGSCRILSISRNPKPLELSKAQGPAGASS